MSKPAIFALLWISFSVAAQQPPELERGFKPDLVYQFSGIDSINLFNGNLNLSLPLGSYSVASDVSYSFDLRYAGNSWGYYWQEPPGGIITPGDPAKLKWDPIVGTAGMGWGLGFGELAFVGSLYGTALPANGSIRYLGPDGSEHHFYETLHEPKCSPQISTNCDPVTPGVWYTRDGSYLRLKHAGNDRIVELPNGQRQRFTPTSGVSWRLQSIYSMSSTLAADGTPLTKWVKFEYVPHTAGSVAVDWKITDSHGREHWVFFHDGDGSRIRKIRLAAAPQAVGPAYAEYDLSYNDYSTGAEGDLVDGPPIVVPRPCITDTDGPVAVPLLRRVAFPEGETWQFEYERSDCQSPAMLKRVTLPTGGRVNWSYQPYPFSTSDGMTASFGVKERCLRRDDNGCSTSNATALQDEYSFHTVGQGKVTVDTYARSSAGTWARDAKVVHYFDHQQGATFGLPFTTATTDGTDAARRLSNETFDCNPETNSCSGTPERRSYVKYEMDFISLSVCGVDFPCFRERNRRVVSSRTSFVTDSFRDITTDFSRFDGLGHYRQTVTNGYGEPGRTAVVEYNSNSKGWSENTWSGSSVGNYALTSTGGREPNYTMLNSSDSWFLGSYTQSSVTENGVTSHTEVCFDPKTGFLHRQRIKSSAAGTNGPHDLLRVWTRDPATGYASSEELFGGDHHVLNTAGSLCNMAVPAHSAYTSRRDLTYEYGVLKTSTFSGMSWHAVHHSAIDRNTGLVLESKDPAGLVTAYGYDRLRRLKSIAPPGVSPTTYEYVPASSAAARVESITGSGTQRTHLRWEFDPFGRISLEKRLMPSGWSVRKTTYNETGQRASVSESENEAVATFDKKTKFAGYDPFGRVGTITTADEKTTSFTYTGDRLTTRTYEIAKPSGDTAVSIRERSDRAGRLVEVIEDFGGTAATTSYAYDQGNRLKRVSMGNDAQIRLFNYDLRGLLASETHPESGTTSYTYDARGNAVTKETPIAVVTHVFDAAGRLTSVSDGQGPLKGFVYDRPNDESISDWSMGKLSTATRYNRSTELGTVTVAETYSYRGLGGRLSRKDTTVTRPSGPSASFYDEYAYNALGTVQTIYYPKCSAGTCMSLSSPVREIVNSYRYGLLTDVAPYTRGFQNPTGITYHPSGVIDTIEHQNAAGTAGPVLKQSIADDKMARVSSIGVTNFCDNLSVSAPGPQPKAVPSNTAANLSVTAVNATSYQWYRVDAGANVALPGQTSATLTVPVVATSVFFVRAGNGTCTVDSDRATVTVLACTPPPSEISAPATIVASTTGTASVVSTAGATYQWSISGGGSILSGQGTPAITFGASCAGTVSLAVAVTKDGCTSTDTHSVGIQTGTVSLTAVGSTTIVQGQSVQLRLTFTGAGPWTVTWSDSPGSPQVVQPHQNPFLRTVSPMVTTSYSVTATDLNGCSMTVQGAPLAITVKPPAPFDLNAVAAAPTVVQLTWWFEGQANRFDVYRSGTAGPIGSVIGAVFSYEDTNVAPSTAYVYTVRAVRENTASDPSNRDLVTTVLFSDDPLIPQVTLMKAEHLTQLRTAVNAVRAAAGMSAVSFPAVTAGVTVISAEDLQALRNALAPARSSLGLAAVAYTRMPLIPGMSVLAADVEELRGGVR